MFLCLGYSISTVFQYLWEWKWSNIVWPLKGVLYMTYDAILTVILITFVPTLMSHVHSIHQNSLVSNTIFVCMFFGNIQGTKWILFFFIFFSPGLIYLSRNSLECHMWLRHFIIPLWMQPWFYYGIQWEQNQGNNNCISALIFWPWFLTQLSWRHVLWYSFLT